MNGQSSPAKSTSDTCEVLLIGSSYFNYNSLANLMQNLADSSDVELYIEMHGQNGLYLSDHAGSPATEAKINERDWDCVVLQGVGSLMAYPWHFTDHPVYPALEILRDKIHANCATTRMIFCMPWAFEDGMTWYQNWTDTFEDMQIHIYNNTLQYSEEIGFEIAPVGWTWYAVLEEYSYPLHYLHMSDWNHPSLKGSYVMACVIYSTVFLQPTTDNPYYAGIPAEEADFYQLVASDTVLNNLAKWNIIPLTTDFNIDNSITSIQLYQNFPNPFAGNTTISYYLPHENMVKLALIDSQGNELTILVEEQQNQGNYETAFNGSWLPSGVYFYQLTVGEFSRIKTMIRKH